MTTAHGRYEPSVSAIGRFPSRGARDEFLRQVKLWNAVEGLPFVTAQSINGGESVSIRTVASARMGVARLVESVGGVVEKAQVHDPELSTPA